MLSTPPHDVNRPLSWRGRSLGALTMRYAMARWRDFGTEDRQFIQRLRRDGIDIATIWDIGASNGAWSLMVGRHVPGVALHLFEPLIGFDKGYCDSVRYYLHRFDNWHLHRTALGAEDGEAEIFVPEMSYGSTLLPSVYARREWRALTVPMRRMDSIVESGEAPPPDLLKIDTQGYERVVLEGGASCLSSVKALILEAWLSRDYGEDTPLFGELADWLGERGFRAIEVAPGYRTPQGWMRSVDMYFVSEPVAATLGYYL